MIKKINKVDILFVLALIVGLLFHISTFVFDFLYPDETFYYTIPLRLINGDSLIQHEWHLSQLSSLFSYLPVRIFTILQGSTDGIIVLMRYVYLLIHTAVAIGIYIFFKKEYGVWAVAASMMFYTQTAYTIYAISYHSMLANFMLLFTFFLVSAVQKGLPKLCIGAGFCFAACCVCNPMFTILFAIYAVLCVLWKIKDELSEKISEMLNKKFSLSDFDCMQYYHSFLSGKAFVFSLTGVGFMAAIFLIFFFFTGGTITSVFQNIENILNSSEYELIEKSLIAKTEDLFDAINSISFKIPFLLPILAVALAVDKKRASDTHRVMYIVCALIVSAIYAVGILYAMNTKAFAVSLPFAIFSVVCYVLTKQKNKIVFYCMWCVCIAGALVHGMVSNALLSAAGIVVAIANIAGVIFVRDLFFEMRTSLRQMHFEKKRTMPVGRVIICITLCLQLIFYGVASYCSKRVDSVMVMENRGPFAGILMSKSRHEKYTTLLSDLDVLKERSDADDPILIVSRENWMYLFVDRPFGTYTALEQSRIDFESLKAFYKQNPDHIPKYIYISELEVMNDIYENGTGFLLAVERLFDHTKEELSGGILLTVTEYKFNTENLTE